MFLAGRWWGCFLLSPPAPLPLSLRLLFRWTSLCRNFNSSSVIRWSPVVWKQRNRRTSYLTPSVDLTHVFCSFVWASGNNLYQASLLRPTLSFGRKKVAWKEKTESQTMNYTELSLSSGHVAWENGQHFATPPLEDWNERRKSMLMMHHVSDVGITSDWTKQFSANQKYYPDLGSDSSSVWNSFCTRFADVTSKGN